MEHVTFKGTQAYPTTRAVSEAIEGCGGRRNAATDRESTVYWARLPVREAERAFDVLAELVVRPLLREEDIGRERDIIVEEIRSYRDDPGQYVFNIFDEAFFGDAPLGWEIAGDEDGVRGLPTERHPRLLGGRYRPANMVVAVAGDIDHDDARRARSTRSSALATASIPTFDAAPAVLPVRALPLREAAQLAQAHICTRSARPAARPP